MTYKRLVFNFFFLLVTLLSTKTSFLASNSEIDSLTNRITVVKNELEKGKTYLNLGSAYNTEYNSDLAIKNIDLAIGIFKQLKNDSLLANSYGKKAVAIINSNDIESGIFYLQKSIKTAKKIKDSASISSSYSYIAGLHSAYLRNYTKALLYQDSGELYLPATKINERIYGYVVKSSIYINIQEFKLALEETNKGIKLSRKNEDVYLSYLLSNKGIALDYAKDYDQAILFYNESLKYGKEEKYKAMAFYNLSQIYEAKGQLDSAFFYNKKALQMFKNLNSKRELNQTYIGAVEIFHGLKEVDSAQYYLTKVNYEGLTDYEQIQYEGLKFIINNSPANAIIAENGITKAMQNNYIDLAQTLTEKLYYYYKKQGKTAKALYFLEFNKQMNDSILSDQKIIDIQKAEARLIIESKNDAIHEKEKENIVLNYTLKNQKLLIYLFVLGVLLLLFFVLFLKKNIKAKKQEIILRTTQLSNEKITRKLSESNLNKAKELILEKNKTIKLLEEDSLSKIDIQEASKALLEKVNTNNEWAQYMAEFEMIYPSFMKAIQEKLEGGKLTRNETRLCTLIKLSLSNKEMAEILFISPESVKKGKQRLAKKFVFAEDIKLSDFILSI